jgi:hypothetical protein
MSLTLIIQGSSIIAQMKVALPECGLKRWTGFPCPLCGSTRSLMAWSDLQVTKAFQFNPMIAMAVAATYAWFGLTMMEALLGGEWLKPIGQNALKLPLKSMLGVLIVLNWIYLLMMLPD